MDIINCAVRKSSKRDLLIFSSERLCEDCVYLEGMNSLVIFFVVDVVFRSIFSR